MVKASSRLPVGSLAFISSEEMLFLRVHRGLREIQVKIVFRMFRVAHINDVGQRLYLLHD